MTTNLSVVEPYAAYFTRPVPDVVADLEIYADLLTKWQTVQNLVSRETLPQMWTRHFADSLQALKLFRLGDQQVFDMGSGGGLPAIPLAIALKDRPIQFTLVEPNARKVSFLRTVARETGLILTVEGRRTDQLDSRETPVPDVITSRALASLTQLCGMAAPFFGPETRAIFHKGREHGEELKESSALWDHDVIIINSETDPDAVLIELTNLRLKTGR